jgi:hypothetical protein
MPQTPDTSLNKIGPRTAVIIGFPLGMGFVLTMLYLSLFPGLDFGIFVSGAGLFSLYVISTVLTSLSIGLLIVFITKSRIAKLQAKRA